MTQELLVIRRFDVDPLRENLDKGSFVLYETHTAVVNDRRKRAMLVGRREGVHDSRQQIERTVGRLKRRRWQAGGVGGGIKKGGMSELVQNAVTEAYQAGMDDGKKTVQT